VPGFDGSRVRYCTVTGGRIKGFCPLVTEKSALSVCAVSRVLSRRLAGHGGAAVKTIYLDPPLRTGSLDVCREAAYPRLLGPEPGHGVAAWPCTRWGLPCQPAHTGRGALLPHHFTLTLLGQGYAGQARLAKATQGGIFSVALSRSRRVGPGPNRSGRWVLPTTVVQRCSDFPPPPRRRERPSTHPTY